MDDMHLNIIRVTATLGFAIAAGLFVYTMLTI